MPKFGTKVRTLCPDIRDMSNREFGAHMDKYHWDEYLGGDLAEMPGVDSADEWVNLYRIMHEQNHEALRGMVDDYKDHIHAMHSDTATILEWCRAKRRQRDFDRDAIRAAAVRQRHSR